MALPAPIAYWPLNEGTGTTSADASGNGHTATLVNGTWDTTLKQFGATALANAGTGIGGSFTAINLGTTHSIALWINGWDGSNDGVVIGGANNYYAPYLHSAFYHYRVGVGSGVGVSPSGLTGAHHLVITRSGTTVTFYVDGALRGTPQTLGLNDALILDTLSCYNTGSPAFAGTIDDVRFYDVALSGAQVAELFALNPDLPSAGTNTFVWMPV